MTTYYAMSGDVPVGAFSEDELLANWKDGRLLPNDLCWARGMRNWERISEIEAIVASEENLGHYAKNIRETERWRTLRTRQHQAIHLESKALRNTRFRIWGSVAVYIAIMSLTVLWAAKGPNCYGTDHLLPGIVMILLSIYGWLSFGVFGEMRRSAPPNLEYLMSRANSMLYERLANSINESVKVWGEAAKTRPSIAGRTPVVISGYAEVFRLWHTSADDYLAQLRWHAVFIGHEETPLIIEEVGQVPCPDRFRPSSSNKR